MDMTEGAVKAIQDPVREAERLTKAVTLIPTPDPRRQLLVQSGTFQDFIVPPPPREHDVYSLADLISYALDKPKAVVWHNETCVTLVLDDDDRRDTVTFDLLKTDAWKKLEAIDEQPVAFSQREFIRLLRLYFGIGEEVITQFRKIDFKVINEGTGQIGKSQESLGRQINAEVRGTADLPEDLIFNVAIYQSSGERQQYAVRLLLEYDATGQKIIAMVESGLLSELEENHQAVIHERLQSSLEGDKDHPSVPVYFGSP